MLAALQLFGEVAITPREYLHTGEGLSRMVSDILALGEDTRVVMEATGRYHEVVAFALHEEGMINAKCTLVAFRYKMIQLATMLPEYETILSMFGVGDITGAQLMAEIGDVNRFPHRSSLIVFAGIDPDVNQSGKHNASSVPMSKRGSLHLRKTLFQIVNTYLKLSPSDEPVYQFLDKKRSDGKPYYVYMTAAAKKFLRIYYARVKEVLSTGKNPWTSSHNLLYIGSPVFRLFLLSKI